MPKTALNTRRGQARKQERDTVIFDLVLLQTQAHKSRRQSTKQAVDIKRCSAKNETAVSALCYSPERLRGHSFKTFMEPTLLGVGPIFRVTWGEAKQTNNLLCRDVPKSEPRFQKVFTGVLPALSFQTEFAGFKLKVTQRCFGLIV